MPAIRFAGLLGSILLLLVQCSLAQDRVSDRDQEVPTVRFKEAGPAPARSAAADRSFRKMSIGVGTPNGVAISPDGKLALLGRYGELSLWDVNKGEKICPIGQSHKGGVFTPRFLGPRLAVAVDGGRQVCIWELRRGELVHELGEAPPGVPSLAVSRDGKLVAVGAGNPLDKKGLDLLTRKRAGADDFAIRVWDADSGKLLHLLHGHTAMIQGLDFTPDNRLVSISRDGTIRFWDTASGKPIQKITGTTPYGMHGSLAALDNDRIAFAESMDIIHVWDMRTNTAVARLRGHSGYITGLASARGHLVSISTGYHKRPDGTLDNSVRVWAPPSYRQVACLEGHAKGVRGPDVTPDGRLAITCSDDGTMRVWDVSAVIGRKTTKKE